MNLMAERHQRKKLSDGLKGSTEDGLSRSGVRLELHCHFFFEVKVVAMLPISSK